MYSIGEFSRISGLRVKTLRFYHERGLLEPAAIDPQTGYRYYDAHNVEMASAIRALRDLELPLDDIATILAECADDQDVVEYLERHKNQLADKLQHYRNLVQTLEQWITQERETRKAENMSEHTYAIEERFVQPQLVAGWRMKGKYSDCGQGFSALARQIGRYISGTPLCLYYDGEYREDDADLEPCFPIRKEVAAEGIHVRELPGSRCVTLIHRGPYETLGRSYARVLKYVKEQGYEVSLPTREVFLKGPGRFFRGNPKKYRTEIQLPISE